MRHLNLLVLETQGRPGEVLSATREDFLLPSDGAGPCHLIWPAVFAGPKDALHAGHQSAKMDVPDMLKVVELFPGPTKATPKTLAF